MSKRILKEKEKLPDNIDPFTGKKYTPKEQFLVDHLRALNKCKNVTEVLDTCKDDVIKEYLKRNNDEKVNK